MATEHYLHRPSGFMAHQGGTHAVFACSDLAAESTTDITFDNPYVTEGEADDIGNLLAHTEYVLRAVPDR